MKIRCTLTLLLVALLTSGTQAASAQTDAALPDCPSDPACLSLFKQGREQSDQGNLREAQRLYLEAYQVQADPAIYYSIARVLHRQGQPAQAAPYYQRFLDSSVNEPELKRKAQEYLTTISPGIKKDQELKPPQPEPKPTLVGIPSLVKPVQPRPLHKRPWIWVAAGTTIAALAIGGAVASRPRQWQPDGGVPSYSIFAVTTGGAK